MIEQGTDYTFFINESRIDLTIPVSVHVTDGELNAVLDQVLARTPYEYAIKSRQILLSLREHSSASAPSGQAVEGVVKDKAGNPLIGASIVVEGTTEGTTSGSDGAFRIVVAGSSARLVVSYLGYETQTVSVGGRTYLTGEMAEDATLVKHLRDSAHDILYTVVNSAAMNGMSEDTEIREVLPLWKIWLICLDVAVVLIEAGCILLIRRRCKRNKQN